MKLLESIKLEEQTLEELHFLISDLIEKYKDGPSIFWYSERFSKDCYMCIYTSE